MNSASIVLAGFIIGRLTCSCRKEQRAIDRYRKDVGAEDEEEVFITPDGSISAPAPKMNSHFWDPLKIPTKAEDEDTKTLHDKTCGDCAHFDETQYEEEEGYCLLKSCVTGRSQKVGDIPCWDGFERIAEEEKTCFQCAHYSEEGEDNTGWCLAMKCRTGVTTKLCTAPCTKNDWKLFKERPDGD